MRLERAASRLLVVDALEVVVEVVILAAFVVVVLDALVVVVVDGFVVVDVVLDALVVVVVVVDELVVGTAAARRYLPFLTAVPAI